MHSVGVLLWALFQRCALTFEVMQTVYNLEAQTAWFCHLVAHNGKEEENVQHGLYRHCGESPKSIRP